MQEFDPSKMNMKKYQKLVQKKARKERNRNVGRTDSLVDAFKTFGGIDNTKNDDAYDFNDYFDCK